MSLRFRNVEGLDVELIVISPILIKAWYSVKKMAVMQFYTLSHN